MLLLAAYKVLPNSRYGNCWSYAVPRWLHRGGYLSLRCAEDVRFLWIFPIPHVQWVKRTPEPCAIEQFIPRKRLSGSILPW